MQQYGHGSALTIAGVLHNTGLVALQADAAAAGAGASLTIAATGTLQNDGTVSLSAEQSNSGLLLRPLPQILKDSGVLTNSGELLVGGGYTTVNSNYGVGAQVLITGVLLNTGSVFVGGGINETTNYTSSSPATLSVQGTTGYLLNQGNISVGAAVQVSYQQLGALLAVSASLVNDGTLSVSGGLADRIMGGQGGTLSVAGSLLNNHDLRVAGGYPAGPGSYGAAYDVGGYGGVLAVSGRLDNTGTLLAQGGGYQSGSEALPGRGATISVAQQGTLSNSGSVLLGAQQHYLGGGFGRYWDNATLKVSGTFSNTGLLVIAKGAESSASVSITATGYLDDRGTITGGGVLTNTNTLALDSNTPVTDVQIVNDHTIDAGGSFNPIVDGPIQTGTHDAGTILINGGSNLTLLNLVDAGQSVVLSNDDAQMGLFPTLSLGDMAQFRGTLTGLFAGAKIDFLGRDVTTATATNKTLVLDIAGGATFDLALDAPLAPGLGLALMPDGTGGTDLTVVDTVPAPASPLVVSDQSQHGAVADMLSRSSGAELLANRM